MTKFFPPPDQPSDEPPEPRAFVPTFEDRPEDDYWDDQDFIQRNGEGARFDDDVEPDDAELEELEAGENNDLEQDDQDFDDQAEEWDDDEEDD